MTRLEVSRSSTNFRGVQKKGDDVDAQLSDCLLTDVVQLRDDTKIPASLRSGRWKTSSESVVNFVGIRNDEAVEAALNLRHAVDRLANDQD